MMNQPIGGTSNVKWCQLQHIATQEITNIQDNTANVTLDFHKKKIFLNQINT